jgi:hypothetical protein
LLWVNADPRFAALRSSHGSISELVLPPHTSTPIRSPGSDR